MKEEMGPKDQFELECCRLVQEGWKTLKQMIRDGKYPVPATENVDTISPDARERIALDGFRDHLKDKAYYGKLTKSEFKTLDTLKNNKSGLFLLFTRRR